MNDSMADYYELRREVSRIIPRERPLFTQRQTPRAVQEKGRKKDYREFKLLKGSWEKQERLLNDQEVNSFIEISCRAAACPMPLNLDVWDGLLCPYGCKYCFANAFRASLYTAFFDNSKTMGLRHCNPDKYKREMDKLMKVRGKDSHTVQNSIAKAIAMEIPIRFGIRFEDFCKEEAEAGVSLELLRYLADHKYPVMINTKSDLVGRPAYVKAMARTKSAVHVTLISSDNKLLSTIEPGAPSYEARVASMRAMASEGIRVVARIEPYLVFINDEPEAVQRYIEDVWDAGVRNITFDTYSYTAKNPGIRQSFKNVGIDWDRMFLLGCDSQGIGSLLLGSFMQMFRDKGFRCSTFDMGNVPDNDQDICCEVGDWFTGGFNYGSSVMAARFIQSHKGPQSWKDFSTWVNEKGGFLSPSLEREAHELWNASGNDAYSPSWARGMTAVGYDAQGIVWAWQDTDFRKDLYNNIHTRRVKGIS